MSSALKRRFNFETVRPVGDVKLEKQIILREAGAMARNAGVEMPPDEDAAELLAATFHELREGVSSLGHRIDKPAAVMSTAEAVSVYYQTMMGAYYYGTGTIDVRALTANLTGALGQEPGEDLERLRGYFSTVVRDKAEKLGGVWKAYYQARSALK